MIWQELLNANPTVAEFRSMVAATYNAMGRVQSDTERIESFRKALVILRELADANPTVTSFQLSLADNYYMLGMSLNRIGKPAEGLELYRKSLAIFQEQADGNPSDHTRLPSLRGGQPPQHRLSPI